MKKNHFTYLTLLFLLFSCSNGAKEKGVNAVHARINAGSEVEQDTIKNLSKDKFDSTFFIGTWSLRSSDLKVLEYSYIKTMPVSFEIVALDQIRHGFLTALSDKSRYPFHLNRIVEDSSLIYLHPAECMCEGLEVVYIKQ